MNDISTPKLKEKKFWDKTEHFDGFSYPAFNLMLEHLRNLKFVIEIGCGSGAWTKHLSKISDNIIGIDISLPQIKELQKTLRNTNASGILADGEFLPIKEGSVDQIIFTFSLHHISNIERCLEGATIRIKKNGFIIMIEPNGINFLRYFAYIIGTALHSMNKNKFSTPADKPVNIKKVIKILNKKGFQCEYWPSSATISTYNCSARVGVSLLPKVYTQCLKIASRVFPNIFGSANFILIAKKMD